MPVYAHGFFRQLADALVHLAQVFLAGDENPIADHCQVMVHVDESVLRDDGGKIDLPIETLCRITCDAILFIVWKMKRVIR